MDSGERQPAPIHWILLFSVVVAIIVSGYKYLITKDYEFLVEAPCNSALSLCYVRDCDNDYCPPNGLSEYRVFSIPASRFKDCSDNSCANVCVAGGPCTEAACSEEAGDSCAGSPPS